MGSGHPLARFSLYGCVFLFVFTEVLFSPFYPQFFQKVFGVDDLQFTGAYLFMCRLAVVAASPMWGWLSRRFDSRKLLLIGQIGTALSCMLMAMADNESSFMLWSLVLLLFKSSYLLLYTLLIQNATNQNAVAANYQGITQGAAAAAALASAGLIQLDDPLLVFWWIAGVDLVQAVICLIVLKRMAPLPKAAALLETTRGEKKESMVFLARLCLTVFTLHFAVTLIRPLFTVFTEAEYGSSHTMSSLLFLLPSLMAIAAIPVMKRLPKQKLSSIYSFSGAMVLLSVLIQGAEPNLFLFSLSRCVFGFFLALCLASLDMKLFQKGAGHHYGMIFSFQNLGLLLAPVSVPILSKDGTSAWPFYAAGILLAVHLISAIFVFRQAAPRQETKAA